MSNSSGECSEGVRLWLAPWTLCGTCHGVCFRAGVADPAQCWKVTPTQRLSDSGPTAWNCSPGSLQGTCVARLMQQDFPNFPLWPSAVVSIQLEPASRTFHPTCQTFNTNESPPLPNSRKKEMPLAQGLMAFFKKLFACDPRKNMFYMVTHAHKFACV